jgi:hypothetical protein
LYNVAAAVSSRVQRAAQFGEAGKQQVGAHRQVGLDAKKEDQDGRHQRAATHAGEAHHQADEKAGKNERKILHGPNFTGLPLDFKLHFENAYIRLSYIVPCWPSIAGCRLPRLPSGIGRRQRG